MAEDFVVDIVLEADSRGIGVEDLGRSVRLPGSEILRASANGSIWLTALVAADGESVAFRMARDNVLDAVLSRPGTVVASTITIAPLDDLYARLDATVTDEDLAALDLRDLVERVMWDRPTVDVRHVDVRSARVLRPA
jgi:hypothetical protein